MAEQNKSDILMQFVLNGNPVMAECAAQKDPKDNYMEDFNPASDAADYSDFFQVTKFDFGFDVSGSDESGSKASKSAFASHPLNKDKEKEKQEKAKKSKMAGFAGWLKASKGEMETVPYRATFEPFSFTRVIDAASPIFFQSCCNLVTFDKATLVRRLSVDSMVNGISVSTPMSFLRLTFETILITNVAWDDGEVLNETCKFICQKFKVEYRQQNSDGVMENRGTADWSWKRDAQATQQ